MIKIFHLKKGDKDYHFSSHKITCTCLKKHASPTSEHYIHAMYIIHTTIVLTTITTTSLFLIIVSKQVQAVTGLNGLEALIYHYF